MNAIQTLLTDHLDIWTAADTEKKSGRGRSSGNADRVYGIKKLRELILELAVRGKLVSQDANDEPASALLPKVLKENARLLKERNKKPNEAPEISDDEITFQLPKGWKYVRNGSLFSLRKGKKPTNISESEIGLPYLDIEALDRDNILRFTDDDKCPRATETDILVVCDGSRSGLVLDGKNGVIGSTLAVIDTPKLIQPFIKLLFMEAYERMNSTMKGAAIPHLDTSRLILEVVGLPPLNEQYRIIAKVGELMAMCEQLEQQQTHSIAAHQALVEALLGTLTRVESQQEFSAAWARIASHFDTLFTTEASIDQLKQTILQLAVMGKLVHQDPNDEPASVLLDRVKAAKDQLALERRTRPADDAEMSEPNNLFETPIGWVWSHVGEVALVQGGKRLPNGAVFTTIPTPHIYIRVTDMKNGTVSETGLQYISTEVQSLISRYTINKEDLYITIAGTIGNVGVVPDSLDGQNLTENAAKIVFRILDKSFLLLALSSDLVQAQFLEKTKQMAQPKLALKRIAGAKFCLPPLAEQHRIVAKVGELMVLCDTLKARLADAQATQLHLADAIVEQAVC